MFNLPLTDHVERESVSTKCNTCKKPTAHEYFNIMPVDQSGEVQVLEMMQLVRRIMICTECATMSLRK